MTEEPKPAENKAACPFAPGFPGHDVSVYNFRDDNTRYVVCRTCHRSKKVDKITFHLDLFLLFVSGETYFAFNFYVHIKTRKYRRIIEGGAWNL